uniref:Uncharacterized protein n=1 Tax=Syphacia muris TaxID=451379 RepID=A0A0N5AAR4_9BILA
MLADESGILYTSEQGKSTIAILRVKIEDAKDSIASLSKELKSEEHSGDENQSEISSDLPKLKMPTFDGQPEEWPTFWAYFERKIDQMKMDPEDKLARLMQTLTGSAKRLVRGFAITRENYPVVLAKLKEEYSNLAKIRLNLRQRLRELPVIHRETDIIPVLGEIELILQQLMLVGANLCHETVQEYLEDAIMEKLPPWLMSQIHLRRDIVEEWNLSHLRKALQQIMKSRMEICRRKGIKIPSVLKIEKTKWRRNQISNANIRFCRQYMILPNPSNHLKSHQ